MDFHLVTETLLGEFDRRNIRFAAIGGFALGFWGVTRSTIDMDFLLLSDDLKQAHETLEGLGYILEFESDNVAQYAHSDTRFGNIDFILAFRELSRKMLDRAKWFSTTNELSIRCLIPEDIIGLKLQAMVNDPTRERRDLADMEALLVTAKERDDDVDWTLLRDYFDLFDRAETLQRLKETIDK